AMLACLEIAFEVIESAQVPKLHHWPESWILVASHALLPARLKQPGPAEDKCSLWILARMQAGDRPVAYRHCLPEPLCQADLQNALLRCMVVQGMAECHAPEVQV
ncbi:MAG TPA: hypothetical protein VFG52_08340, partial [Xanthomonadales bacterium]|nr:hypothetical protein [Xanthomonadales bacterium]